MTRHILPYGAAAACGVGALALGLLWHADVQEPRSTPSRFPHTREAVRLPRGPLTEQRWPQVEEALLRQLRYQAPVLPATDGAVKPVHPTPLPLDPKGTPRGLHRFVPTHPPHGIKGPIARQVESYLAWLRRQDCVVDARPALSGSAEGVTAYGIRTAYPAQLPIAVDFRVVGEDGQEEVQTCTITLVLEGEPTLHLLRPGKTQN